MTTKQGESYLKKKSFSIIEGNADKSQPLTDIYKIANPTPYDNVSKQNSKHAKDALNTCKKRCKEIAQVEACNLGCQIKYEANTDSTTTTKNPINLNIPYDKWKKSYTTIVDKNSNTKISDAYKNWSPYHTFGNIFDGWQRIWYSYWVWNWRRWRHIKRRTYYWRKKYKRGIIKKGKLVSVPAVWKKCNWTETHKHPDKNVGRFEHNKQLKSCYDILTDNNIPDIDPNYYRDYSIHNMVDACEFGMNNYERKNCKVSADKTKITCNETKKYGSIEYDIQRHNDESKKFNSVINPSKQSFTNYKRKEGFSNACKNKCYDYIDGSKNIIDMESNDDCYTCEVKHNPYIRYSAAREKLIKEAKYKASSAEPLFLRNQQLKGQQESQKSKLNAKTNTQTDLVNRNKTLFDELYPYYHINAGNPDLSISKKDCSDNYHPSNNENILGYTEISDDTKPKGCIISDPSNAYVEYNESESSTANCGTDINNIRYNCLQREPSKSYSKKRHTTINAYLEDMKTRNPSKNVEYVAWIGLLAAAGISTAFLLKA